MSFASVTIRQKPAPIQGWWAILVSCLLLYLAVLAARRNAMSPR
jgi:hypothetical protein